MLSKTTLIALVPLLTLLIAQASPAALQTEQPMSPPAAQPGITEGQPADGPTQRPEEAALVQPPEPEAATTPAPGRAVPAPNTPANPAPGGQTVLPLSPILLLLGLLAAAVIIGIISIFRRKK